MFSAWPLSGRSPVSGSTSAYLTDELPELSTRTRPEELGEPAMAGMLPGAGYGSRSGALSGHPGTAPGGYGDSLSVKLRTGLGRRCHFLALIRTSIERPGRPRPARDGGGQDR